MSNLENSKNFTATISTEMLYSRVSFTASKKVIDLIRSRLTMPAIHGSQKRGKKILRHIAKIKTEAIVLKIPE